MSTLTKVEAKTIKTTTRIAIFTKAEAKAKAKATVATAEATIATAEATIATAELIIAVAEARPNEQLDTP
jgi:hypothetical protein